MFTPILGVAAPVAITVRWIMIGSVIAFLVVEGIVGWQAFRRPDDAPGPLKGFSRRRLEAAWMLTPAVILASLLLWTSSVLGRDAHNVPSDPDLVVHVTGHQFYWQLQYEVRAKDGSVRTMEVAPNQLHLPQGKVARLDIASADVVHGFWVPQFQVKTSVAPNSPDSLWLKPSEKGEFNIVCAELCGNSHFAMRGFVHVESEEEFSKWLASAEVAK